MNGTETKRRGRPPRAQEVEIAEDPTVDADATEPVAAPTPPCPRCGRPTQQSTRLLKTYNLTALRCIPCRSVAIKEDPAGEWYDEGTARAGSPPLIARLARTLFSMRRRDGDAPDFDPDGFEAAITGEWGDDRWTAIPG